MRATQSMSITLPAELAEMVRAKVASGEYASESEVIHDGLLTLVDHDAAIETWLVEEVGPTYDEFMANPDAALSPEEVRVHLETTARMLLERQHQSSQRK